MLRHPTDFQSIVRTTYTIRGLKIGSPAWLRPKNLCLTDKRDASFTTGEFEKLK